MNFDEIAAEWDSEYRINRAKILSKSLLDNISNTASKNVLEFGCGTGLISCELANKFSQITCVDTSEKMIDVLNKKIKDMKILNISTDCIDLISCQDITAKYELIYTSMVLHHIKNIDKIIHVFHSILNDNGILAIIDLDEDDGSFHKNEIDFNGHHGFKRNEIKNILLNNNFNNISFKTVFQDEREIDDRVVPYSLFLCLAQKL